MRKTLKQSENNDFFLMLEVLKNGEKSYQIDLMDDGNTISTILCNDRKSANELFDKMEDSVSGIN